MTAHITDLLGAWALDICDDVEASIVEAHLEQCPECAEQARKLRSAAGWLGIEQQVMKPPPELRATTLAKARLRRPPKVIRTLIEAYGSQVEALDRTLVQLKPSDWRRPDPRHADVAGLVRHLIHNDAALGAGLKLPTVSGDSLYATWRTQADTLLSGLRDDVDLDQAAPLASTEGPQPGTLRQALVQRAFETWIHADDIRGSLGQSLLVPQPEQVHRIAELAVALLPQALAAHGLRPAQGVSYLILSGPGGGEWAIPVGGFTLRTVAVDFARLVANRRPPENLEYTVDGDYRLALRVLRVATTLGCD